MTDESRALVRVRLKMDAKQIKTEQMTGRKGLRLAATAARKEIAARSRREKQIVAAEASVKRGVINTRASDEKQQVNNDLKVALCESDADVISQFTRVHEETASAGVLAIEIGHEDFLAGVA